MRYYLNFSLQGLEQALQVWGVLLVVLLPLSLWVGRSRPWIKRLKGLAFYALASLYVVGVISYTFLPLPSPDEDMCPADGWGNTYPRFFLGWSYTLASRANDGLIDTLLSVYSLQILLNIALFMPLGFLARWRWGVSFRWILLASFATSLTIELTQLTGFWGYYACPIRTFDAEDLFNNTLGAVLGWSLLAWWQNRGRVWPGFKAFVRDEPQLRPREGEENLSSS